MVITLVCRLDCTQRIGNKGILKCLIENNIDFVINEVLTFKTAINFIVFYQKTRKYELFLDLMLREVKGNFSSTYECKKIYFYQKLINY